MSANPIGVMDSGIGGLFILNRIHALMPAENLLYVADSAHAPYGDKGADYVQQRCRAIMDFFVARRAKAVVLACNTATAAAVASLRAEYDLPIVGMEPAIKPAVLQSRRGVVGVLATAGTIDSEKFIDLHSRYADKVELIIKACPGLVDHIEQLVPDEDAIVRLLQDFTAAFREKGGDILVLGCTHYSLIADLIAGVVGPEVSILDISEAVVRELGRRLRTAGLENTGHGPGVVEFFSTGVIDEQRRLIARHWGRDILLSGVD